MPVNADECLGCETYIDVCVLGCKETVNALGISAPPDLSLKGRAIWIGIDGKIAGAIVIQDVGTGRGHRNDWAKISYLQ